MTTNPHGLQYVDADTFHEMLRSKAAVDDVAVVKFMLNEDVKAHEDTRRATFAISTSKVDRDQDTVDVHGWKLGPYKKNPVVLWAHDYKQPPIATGHDTAPNEDKLLSTAQFFPAEVSQFADSIYQMVKLGGLRAASVGFRPLKHKFNEDRRGVDILEAELLEWSVVPIPANPAALIQRAPKSCLKAIESWCEQYLDETYGTKGVWVPRFQVEEAFKFMTEQKSKLVTVPDIKHEGCDVGEPFETEKPYPNEHACRLRPPSDFEKDSFRRGTRKHDGKTYSVIVGQLKGEDTMTEQAYRYDKDVWTAAQAKSHCEGHDGMEFEPASGKEGVDLHDEPVLELADEELVFIDNHVQLNQAIGDYVKATFAEAISQTIRARIDYARGRIS